MWSGHELLCVCVLMVWSTLCTFLSLSLNLFIYWMAGKLAHEGKWQFLGVNCTCYLVISPVVNGSLFLLRESFSEARLGARCQNVSDFAACAEMEVAFEQKRGNTTIIAGPDPQWSGVWFLCVQKGTEPVHSRVLVAWCNNHDHPRRFPQERDLVTYVIWINMHVKKASWGAEEIHWLCMFNCVIA